MNWGAGHWWTIAPALFSPKVHLSSRPWRAGPLTGRLYQGDSNVCVVLVHGLGGSIQSPYVQRAATCIVRRGWNCLAINLRGADRGGGGLYHAGLFDDLDIALSSFEVDSRVFVVGFSLGGHVALRWSVLGKTRRRAVAVATLCSPLNLGRGADDIDSPHRWLYRTYLLQGLRDIFQATYEAGDPGAHRLNLTPQQARSIGSIREWDHRVVAPYFGFSSADDYYRSVGVAALLPDLGANTLMTWSEQDPMILSTTIRKTLASRPTAAAIQWVPGGHVGFPGGPNFPVFEDVLDWCASR